MRPTARRMPRKSEPSIRIIPVTGPATSRACFGRFCQLRPSPVPGPLTKSLRRASFPDCRRRRKESLIRSLRRGCFGCDARIDQRLLTSSPTITWDGLCQSPCGWRLGREFPEGHSSHFEPLNLGVAAARQRRCLRFPDLVALCRDAATGKGLRRGGIEGLMGRWVGGTMGGMARRHRAAHGQRGRPATRGTNLRIRKGKCSGTLGFGRLVRPFHLVLSF
jgi:hypothetical protein